MTGSGVVREASTGSVHTLVDVGLFLDTTELDRGGTRLVVGGEVDLATVPALRRALADAVLRGGDIELDLFMVGFIDSEGLVALIAAHDAIGPTRRITIVDSSPAVSRLLRVMGLAGLFGVGPAEVPPG